MLTFRLFVVHQKCDKMYCDNYQLFAVHQKCDKMYCDNYQLLAVHQNCDKMYCDNYQLFAVHQKCDKMYCDNNQLTILLSTAHKIIQPIPVKARSEVWVCSRSIVGLRVRILLGHGRLSFMNVL